MSWFTATVHHKPSIENVPPEHAMSCHALGACHYTVELGFSVIVTLCVARNAPLNWKRVGESEEPVQPRVCNPQWQLPLSTLSGISAVHCLLATFWCQKSYSQYCATSTQCALICGQGLTLLTANRCLSASQMERCRLVCDVIPSSELQLPW